MGLLKALQAGCLRVNQRFITLQFLRGSAVPQGGVTSRLKLLCAVLDPH